MSTKDEITLIKNGIECYKRSDFQNALKIFSEVIETNNKSVDAFFYLANIFHLRGEIGKAIKAFSKVLELEPNHTDAAISLSVLYNDIGKYDEGDKIFKKASERVKNQGGEGSIQDAHINKMFSLKHLEIAEMYVTYNRFDEALFEYNKASALDVENLEVKLKIAKVYAKKGFVSKAYDELRTLKNEQPAYMPVRIALGVLHYGNGRILEAQTEWENVLVKDPGNDQAKMYLNLSKTATETKLR